MSEDVAYRPYVPRAVNALGVLPAGPWSFRFYHIEAHPEKVLAAELKHACLDIASTCRMRMEALPNRKAGFIILHRDDEDVWLNLYWWTYDSILSRLIFRADPASELEFKECVEPYLACVWELVPIQHESNSWVRHMLGSSGSLEAYMDSPQMSGLY